MLGPGHVASVARSRETLLDEIGEAPDLTFVRGYGNIGDELIFAGTRELLSGHVYREIEVEQLPASSGGTAVLTGSGAFSREYHEFMPELLAIAELRFDRVIVLPSSFEVAVDAVRAALRHTSATVFAREPVSYKGIEGLCRARLAHDCAFFFDYAAHRAPGSGTLNAFRTDRERAHDAPPLPGDNEDISVSCATLDLWLARIGEHAVVRTDRAHVMIAAALMGKEVEFAPSSYFKLDALAAGSLGEFPVRPLATASAGARRIAPRAVAEPATRERLISAIPAPPAARSNGRPRVTAVVLTRERAQTVGNAVRSVTTAGIPARVLVIGQNADAPTRQAIEALHADEPAVELRLADRDLGCAGGRQLGVELTGTEFVLFLDDDAELMPGALEHLVADLDGHPEAAAVTALVVDPDGTVQHFGGWVEDSGELASFELHGGGLRFDDPALASTGPSGWAPGTATLIRTRLFDEVALDSRMASYYEDNDWCLRVERLRPGSFRRCRDAIAVHRRPAEPASGPGFDQRASTVRRLCDHAHFFRKHGVLLGLDLPDLVPELRRADGTCDLPAARLLLTLIEARGSHWTLMEWMNGGLAPLLTAAGELEIRVGQLEQWAAGLELRAVQADAALAEQQDELTWLRQRHETLVRIERGGWWRTRERLLPAVRVASKLRRAVSRTRGP